MATCPARSRESSRSCGARARERRVRPRGARRGAIVFLALALRKCDLTVHISTKLNRSHLVHGEVSFILPVSDGRRIAWLHAHGDVLAEEAAGEAEDGGPLRRLTVRLNPKELGQFASIV